MRVKAAASSPAYVQEGLGEKEKHITRGLLTNLVFHRNRVPGHINAFYRSKRGKGLANGIFSQFIVYGAHIHTAHDGQGALPLSCHLYWKEELAG